MATKKASKKASKKESKKAKKASSKKAAKSDSNAVTLADLAKEFKLTGQKARQRLRAAGIEREEGGRWSWEPGSAALKAAKKALAGD